jgi:hypothetical protein
MAYNLPVNFVKVSVGRSDNKQSDVAICITRIVAMMSTDIYQARKTITAEKKAGTLINAAGIEKVKTAIFLDNGSVVASPLSVSRILSAIRKANIKADPNTTNKMKVLDVPHYEDDEEIEDDEDFEEDDDEF